MNELFRRGFPAACDKARPNKLSPTQMERPMSDFTSGNSLNRMEAHEAAIGSISRLMARAIDGMIVRFREERTRRQLMKLDDRMLRDIGLSRLDLYAGRLSDLNRSNWPVRGHPSGM
jgi:uncharacterized protein YjiS (DUF1127 family)